MTPDTVVSLLMTKIYGQPVDLATLPRLLPIMQEQYTYGVNLIQDLVTAQMAPLSDQLVQLHTRVTAIARELDSL